MTETVLNVPNISCEHCERTVVETLSPAIGVENVTVDIPARTVRVTYDADRVGIDELSAILAAEDYPVAAASH